MLSKWIVVGSLMILTCEYIYAGSKIRGYSGGGQQEGGGEQAFTVVYGKPQNTGRLSISVDVQKENIPIKYYGRKPYDGSRMFLNLGGPEDRSENARQARAGGGQTQGGGGLQGSGGSGGGQGGFWYGNPGFGGGQGGGVQKEGGEGDDQGFSGGFDDSGFGGGSSQASEPTNWYHNLAQGNPNASLYINASSSINPKTTPVDKSNIMIVPLPADDDYDNLVDEIASKLYSPSTKARKLPKLSKLLNSQKPVQMLVNEDALSKLLSESLTNVVAETDDKESAKFVVTKSTERPSSDISIPLSVAKKLSFLPKSSLKSTAGKYIPFISKEGIYGVLIPAREFGLPAPVHVSRSFMRADYF